MSNSNKIKVIITGTTGMVGEGVLLECLDNPTVDSVLMINRRPLGIEHPKLKEIIHKDFYDITPIENELKGYDACFFCLGISSVGLSKDEYFKITYTLTMHVAEVLVRNNPNMVFEYISGASTDSTEKGRSNWARVKGKTENDLMKLPFVKVYAIRPGFIKPMPGQKNVNKFYKYVNWMFPILRALSSGAASTVQELGKAMINAATIGYEEPILEVKDIVEFSKK